MTFNRTIYFILLCSFFLGCHLPSEGEFKRIEELNKEHPTYHFYSGKDISGAYLNVEIKSVKVDTVDLNRIFDEVIEQDNNYQTKWVYLNVFDFNNKYLFTIVKEGTDYKYFKEANIS